MKKRETVEDYPARGGRIQQIPRGVSGEEHKRLDVHQNREAQRRRMTAWRDDSLAQRGGGYE